MSDEHFRNVTFLRFYRFFFVKLLQTVPKFTIFAHTMISRARDK